MMVRSSLRSRRATPPCVRLVVSAACLALLSCGGDKTGAAGSSSAADPAASAKAPTSSATAAGSAAAPPSASAAPAAPPLTPAEFCARAVKIGETNMAACPTSEQANVPALGHVKDLASAKKECEIRVGSKNVEYHPDAAGRCIDAAEKRGGKTTFFTFDLVPACREVLTGKAGAGQPALYPEECATGLLLLGSRCVKPVAKNGECIDYTGGLLGKPSDHPPCEPGLGCFMTRYSADGFPPVFHCLEPQPIGARCQIFPNACAEGTSCYQGKCRALGAEGGACMAWNDCGPGLTCDIQGGVFGTCKAKPPGLETCGPPKR